MLWVILEISVLQAGLGLNCSWELIFLSQSASFVFLSWFGVVFCSAREKM